MLKRRGPSTDVCGSPLVAGLQEEFDTSTVTLWAWLNHFSNMFSCPCIQPNILHWVQEYCERQCLKLAGKASGSQSLNVPEGRTTLMPFRTFPWFLSEDSLYLDGQNNSHFHRNKCVWRHVVYDLQISIITWSNLIAYYLLIEIMDLG